MGKENEFGYRFHEFEVPVGLGSRAIQYIVCNMEPKIQFWQFEHKNKSDEQDQGEGTERGEQGAKRQRREKKQDISKNQQQKWEFWWDTLGKGRCPGRNRQ